MLKQEIFQIKRDLNDIWCMYIESEKSAYNKQSVEKIIELNELLKAKENMLINLMFNFPQKKTADIKNIKLYSSSNIKIEKLIASKKVRNIEASGEKDKLSGSKDLVNDKKLDDVLNSLTPEINQLPPPPPLRLRVPTENIEVEEMAVIVDEQNTRNISKVAEEGLKVELNYGSSQPVDLASLPTSVPRENREQDEDDGGGDKNGTIFIKLLEHAVV